MMRKVKDTDFMSDLDAATHQQAHRAAKLLMLAIAGFFAFILIWSSISEIEVITRGTGQVVPTNETQVVQSLEGGILKSLMVREGDRVRKGQVLLQISDVAFSSEEKGTEAQSMSLRAKRARLQAEAKGIDLRMERELHAMVPQIVANETALYNSRQEELKNAKQILENKIQTVEAQISENKAEIRRFQESLNLLNEELKITKQMVESRAMPKLEEIRLRREISEAKGKIEARNERVDGLEAQLRATRKELEDQDNQFLSKALGELNEVESRINQLDESLKSIEDRVYRTDLRAPVDGIVNMVAVKTIGGVIEPAQHLVEIVPIEDELKIISRVSPNDIAFLSPGQKANVKITAYDPQRYGSLEGELVRIGANSVNDRDGNIYFEIEVTTEKNHLGEDDNPLPIIPGMVAETEIITGKRTIMDYLLKPVIRARDRALTER